ncbi:hypothetical protein ABIA30_003289 [Mycobacterium sp. MAA66]|uniref:MmpS family transport accessory protein n=1 Tax=Mycobacterium sp. MAA66 TaxID=3156297 RepID=UPI00351642DE
MSDPAGRDGPGPTQPIGYSYPAYADQVPYQPTQQFPSAPNNYSPLNEPDGPRRPTPRWLWILAGLSVLLVLGLVIALVVINSNEQQTLVAPPPIPEPTRETTTTPSTPSATAAPTPIPMPIPLPGMTTPPGDVTPPGESATPGETETVVYSVTGTGRAINITYIDNGNVLQTEFNVMLPWSKEVELATASARSASVSVVNVGPPVSCAISIDGTPVQHHTGMGLTICSAMNRGMGRS